MESVFCRFNLIFLSGFLCYCVMALDWPKGYYGLPMAKTGCPDGATFMWKTGWIYQNTEKYYPSSSRSTSFHIEGLVRDSNVNRSFCIKTHLTNDHRRPSWPAGTYCIYERTRNCPRNFREGIISWHDEVTSYRQNQYKGTLPTHYLNWEETRMHFCCRSDGLKSSPVDLPTRSPFYLFAHSSEECQQVRWTISTSEWIYYDTEDDYNVHDFIRGPAPYVPGGKGTGHKIYYCYYTSCQNNLNMSTGSIQSPGFPSNYSNGQHCSWNISVNASQTILVHLVNFSLGDINDRLMFYDGRDDSAPLVASLHGGNASSVIVNDLQSSSSNMFVVFRTNEVNSDIGFKALYRTTDTLTVSPPTSSIQPTTIGTEMLTDTPQKITDSPDIVSTSRDPHKTSTFEPSPAKKNSSKSYEMFKKTCVQQSHTALTAVAVVIPVICMIAVIAMAGYLFLRLRTLREKSSDVSVRYSPESVNNPSYVSGDAVMQARVPSASNAYENKEEGDVYHEIGHQTQATNNPLYQSTDTDKHVYASFA